MVLGGFKMFIRDFGISIRFKSIKKWEKIWIKRNLW
jgi:hypothetical protein